MTVGLLAFAAAVAGLGTRLAVLPLVAAAVVAARSTSLAVVSTWVAAMAAGVVLIGRVPTRRLALPIAGAAAALAAGSARNGAAVLGIWVLSTGATIFALPRTESSRRWAAGLIGSDVLVAVAVALTASRGFEGWPQTLRTPGVICLFAAAAIRVLFAAGPVDGDVVGPVAVRAQWAVLIALATTIATRSVAHIELAVGAVAFAIAVLLPRDEMFDAMQEAGLVTVAFAMTTLGLAPIGWAWGALAAGMLIHHLRLSSRSVGLPRGVANVLVIAGLGVPLFPVVLAELEGAVRVRGGVGAVVATGLVAGLLLRSTRRVGDVVEPKGVVGWATGSLVAVLATVAAFWAPVLSQPHPPAGETIGWLPAVAVASIVAFALFCGFLLPAPAAAVRAEAEAPSFVSTLRARLPEPASALELVDRVATERSLVIGLGVLALAAVALWVVGAGRGFL